MIQNVKQRITIFDITRFVAMLFMVQGHTIYAFLDFNTIDNNSLWWQLWSLNRGFTAPVFLLVSGAVQAFANKKQANGKVKDGVLLKRIILGIILILLSYIMHLPSNIQTLINFDINGLTQFFQVNILQLIGVCLIISILLINFIKSESHILLITLILAISFATLANFIGNIDIVKNLHPAINCYLTYDYKSLFPLFPNASYYFFGLAFGFILKNYTTHFNQFIKNYGIVISISFFLIYLLFHDYKQPVLKSIFTLDKSGVEIVIFRLSFVFLYISFLSLFNKYLKENRIILMFGKRALLVYILHLYFIYNFLRYNPIFDGYFQLNKFSLVPTLNLVLLVFLLTFGTVYLIDLILVKFKYGKHFLISITLILIINKLFWLF